MAGQYEQRKAIKAMSELAGKLGFEDAAKQIAQLGGDDRQMEEIARMYGLKPDEAGVGQVGDKEYSTFGSRVEQLAAQRQQVAKLNSILVSMAADALITAITGGVYAPVLLGALAGAVAGMVSQEIELGSEYKLLSEENADAVLVAVATAGAKKGFDKYLELRMGLLDELEGGEAIAVEAVRDTFGGLSEAAFTNLLADKLPTDEEIAHAAAQRLFGMGSAAGGKAFEQARALDPAKLLTKTQWLTREVVNRGAPAAFNALGVAAITAAKDGGGAGTGLDWVAGVTGEALKGFTTSVKDTIKGAMAAQRGA